MGIFFHSQKILYWITSRVEDFRVRTFLGEEVEEEEEEEVSHVKLGYNELWLV